MQATNDSLEVPPPRHALPRGLGLPHLGGVPWIDLVAHHHLLAVHVGRVEATHRLPENHHREQPGRRRLCLRRCAGRDEAPAGGGPMLLNLRKVGATITME